MIMTDRQTDRQTFPTRYGQNRKIKSPNICVKNCGLVDVFFKQPTHFLY